MKRIAAEVPPPLVVNNIEGGATPLLSLEELNQMGYFSVGYVLSGLFAAAWALDRTFRHLIEHGDTEAVRGQMMDFKQFTELIGLEEKYQTDEKYKT